MNREERKKLLNDDTTSTDSSTEQNEGISQDSINSIIAELSKNYNKDEYIAPPEKAGIFVKGYVNILGGKPGVGKSWQVIRWMRDLSRGGDCFGGVVQNEPPRKMLLIAGELPKKEMERRCRLLEDGDDIKRNYDNFVILDGKESEAKGLSLFLDDEAGQRNIEAVIAYHNPDVVILDSFISFFKGNESKSEDVTPAMNFLERIAEKYNVAATIVHHIRKRMSREQLTPIDIDDFIGSSAFLRKGGFLFTVENMYGSKTVFTRQVKSWLETIPPFAYQTKAGFYGGVVMEVVSNAEETIEQLKLEAQSSKGKPKSESQANDWKDILIAYLQGRGSTGATFDEIMNALKRDKEKDTNTTKTQLRRMVTRGELIKLKRGIFALPESLEENATNNAEQLVDDNDDTDNEEMKLDFEDE